MKCVRLFFKAVFVFIFVLTGSMVAKVIAQSPGLPPPPPASAPPASVPSTARPTPPAQTPTSVPAAIPAADPKDVATMDAIVASLYDVISGPAGQKRNWDRFRSLFIPGARLIPTGRRPTGEVVSRARTPEEYITGSTPLFDQNGFFEKEVSRRVEKFGNIAHIFSTYESRHKADDEKPFARGINSIQLMNDGKRWWIVTVFWQGEDENNPLPSEYLRSRP